VGGRRIDIRFPAGNFQRALLKSGGTALGTMLQGSLGCPRESRAAVCRRLSKARLRGPGSDEVAAQSVSRKVPPRKHSQFTTGGGVYRCAKKSAVGAGYVAVCRGGSGCNACFEFSPAVDVVLKRLVCIAWGGAPMTGRFGGTGPLSPTIGADGGQNGTSLDPHPPMARA